MRFLKADEKVYSEKSSMYFTFVVFTICTEYVRKALKTQKSKSKKTNLFPK